MTKESNVNGSTDMRKVQDEMKELVKFYNLPENRDKATLMKDDLRNTKDILVDDLNKILERDKFIEVNMEKAQALENNSSNIKKSSKKLAIKMKRRKQCMTCCMILFILIIIGGLAVLVLWLTGVI